MSQLTLGTGECAEKRGAHFCDQFLEGIRRGAECMPAGDTLTVQTRPVARPVCQLMQSRCVVAADVLELSLRR
ncbi:hypothetical protein D3C78_1805370 [compost metagenome]